MNREEIKMKKTYENVNAKFKARINYINIIIYFQCSYSLSN
jgi:hypothetical protein